MNPDDWKGNTRSEVAAMSNRFRFKWHRSYWLIIVILPFVFWDIFSYFSLPDLDNPGIEKKSIYIPRGANLSAIVDTLQENGLVEDKDLFIIWLTSLGKDRSLKAGYFEIPVGLTYAQLAEYLSKARSKEIKVTLLEGWRITDIAGKLEAAIEIDSTRFVELSRDTTFIRSLGLGVNSLEGYLLPDTYNLFWGMDEKQLIRLLVRHCLAIFDDEAKQQMDNLKMSVHRILTLASIIEGEAMLDDERATIASVYYNRLRRRIKLQADPTIQYILPGPPRRLLYDDLKIDSPYNTYKYYGLPPGPINNPGRKSILAALYPAKTGYIYFVARGDGGHTFTRTAAEHAREKAKFNRLRKQVYRKRKMQNR